MKRNRRIRRRSRRSSSRSCCRSRAEYLGCSRVVACRNGREWRYSRKRRKRMKTAVTRLWIAGERQGTSARGGSESDSSNYSPCTPESVNKKCTARVVVQAEPAEKGLNQKLRWLIILCLLNMEGWEKQQTEKNTLLTAHAFASQSERIDRTASTPHPLSRPALPFSRRLEHTTLRFSPFFYPARRSLLVWTAQEQK